MYNGLKDKTISMTFLIFLGQQIFLCMELQRIFVNRVLSF